jgi:hypothetical protein
MKKTYKITFRAELSEEDVRAMNKYFFDTMNESMQIAPVWGLELEEEADDNSTTDKEYSFEEVLPVVQDWFSFLSDDDYEDVAQTFTIGLNEGKDCYELLKQVCEGYNLDVDEFEGFIPELIGEEDEEDDDYCGLGEELGKKLIDLFCDGLSGWTWESWCDAGSVDKEEIVAEALSALPDVFRISASEERVYELFWEWASGLEEDAFEDEADYDEDVEYEEEDE